MSPDVLFCRLPAAPRAARPRDRSGRVRRHHRATRRAGGLFPLVYLTGAGTSAARGYPDYGLLTMTEMVDNAAVLARAVSVPVLADGDTGYGNELNVTRTIRELESRGVAGVQGNCFQNGVLPVELPEDDVQALAVAAESGEPVTVDLREQRVRTISQSWPFAVPAPRRQALLDGLDDLELALQDGPLVSAWEERDRQARPWAWLTGEVLR